MEVPPSLDLARDYHGSDRDRRQLSRAVESGAAVRVRRGAYLRSEEWAGMSGREQHVVRMAAVAATRESRPVFSHESAAAVWNLPLLRPWPEQVHVTIDPNLGTRSRAGIVRHSAHIAAEDIVDLGPLLVTSVARTVLDLAATARFIEAVVIADRSLLIDRLSRRPPLTTRSALEAARDRARWMRAHARTSAVLGFAVSESESPLESVSRVNLRVAGFPRPSLQVPHYDAAGFIGVPDFYWPEYGIVGEADGDVKYLDAAVRGDRSAEQVVLDEKVREDRLRALPRIVSRWRWNTAISAPALRSQLMAAGLPSGVKWR